MFAIPYTEGPAGLLPPEEQEYTRQQVAKQLKNPDPTNPTKQVQ